MELSSSRDLETTFQIPFESIYKIHILDDDGKITRVHIFCANTIDESMLPNVFSDLQIAYFNEQNVDFVFSPLLIHKDDTIRTVKRKILQDIDEYYQEEKKDTFSSSPEQLYLFAQKSFVISPSDLFQEITEGKRNSITKEEFYHYASILNLTPKLNETSGLVNKNEYTWNDWISICNKSKTELFVPVGMSFQNRHDKLFPTNPFHEQISTIPIRYQFQSGNPLISLEKSLLLNYISDQTDIMACFAKNVFQYANTNDISQKYMCQLYFPQLEQYDINGLDDLLLHSHELHDKYKTEYSPWLQHRNEIVDIFHEIYWSRKQTSSQSADLPYVNKGVKEIHFTIYPHEDSAIFPLEYLFKQVHSTREIPFIKYNPGIRRENMYRLYSKEISKNGRKIPFLDENIIFRLNREMKKGHHLSFFIDKEDPVYLYIDGRGKTLIHCILKEPKELSALEMYLTAILADVFEMIKTVMQPLGYNASLFTGFQDLQIHNMNIQYTFSLALDNRINFDKEHYLQSVFDVENTNISKTATMKFKRVENYKEMDAKASLITGMITRGNSNQDIIDMLMSNFGLTNDAAIIEFGEFRSQHQLFKEKILDNPGFPISLKMKPLKNELLVVVHDISSTEYLNPIFIYLDTFLRMSQSPKTISLPKRRITFFEKVFKGKYHEEPDENIVTATGIERHSQFFAAQPLRFGEEELPIEPEIQGIVFDDDYDYYKSEEGEEGEESEEGEEGEEGEYYGGDIEDRKKELDGKSIKNPTPFFKKMLDLDPVLYVTEETSKFPLYSKACPSGDRRQPVVLTNDEKRKIDETNPGSYGHALHHGSDKKNKLWYVCPRYWCLLTNSSITDEDVKAGKCGNIIPRGADSIPQGAYVYEFNYPKVHMKDGKYTQHVPGFLKKDKHPNGLCIPCCFGKEWASKDQTNRRKQCGYGEETDVDSIANTKQTARVSSYIIGPVTYPLPQNRWGFMPTSAQLFFNEDSSKLVDSQNPSVILPNASCLLRYGIEQSEKRSFIGAIAYFYAYKQGLKEPPTIENMCKILVTIINLDIFMKVQNGNLPNIFRPKGIDLGKINIDKYSNTQFFKRIDLAYATQVEYLEDTISSYENFIDYMQDEHAEIDHTFLWDIVCMENADLLRDGMNLVILKITDNDITEKVQYICPSSMYSNIEYDPRKETIILLLQDRYYEPVHLYENIETIVVANNNKVVYTLKQHDAIVKNTVVNANHDIVYKLKSNETRSHELIIKKAFLEHTALDYIKHILLMIKQTSQTKCQPLPSMPRKYKFKRAIPALELLRILKTHHYKADTQVVNYRNKTIALLVTREEGQDKIYVPCYPSAVLDNLHSKFMNDSDLWLDYRNTRNRLQGISNDSDGKIPCQVKIKIVEDGSVVGFLTETNQFIQINPPTPSMDEDDIPEVHHSNYAFDGKHTNVDTILSTHTNPDAERVQTIQKITLETDFYNVFRSLARILLHEYANNDIHMEILSILDDHAPIYKKQLQAIEAQLRKLMGSFVSFQEIEDKDLSSIHDIMVCKGKTNCNTLGSWKTCMQTDKGLCQNVFPKTHLLGKRDNERVYFGRLADELLRYERIRTFMLQPKKYLNIGSSHYQIHDSELFLLESLLQKEYFHDLLPYNRTKYIENIEYDNAQPSITQKYDNKITLKEQDEIDDSSPQTVVSEYITDCILQQKTVIGNEKAGSWRPLFPSSTKEIIFEKNNLCSFMPLIYILQDVHKAANISIQNVKTSLWNHYKRLIETHGNLDKIIGILRKQGKRVLMDSVRSGKISLEQAIFSDDYYLTDIDYWVFCSFTKLPVILFSSTTLKYISSQINWLRLGGSNINNETYYFIRSPVDGKLNTPTSYHLLIPSIALEDVKTTMFMEARQGIRKYDNNWQTIENYLLKYHLIKK
jgi:hypothetical protein